MSTQTQIIIFCMIGVVATPLGTFIAIKSIKKIWGQPINVLRRNNQDIELQNVIEPIQTGFNPRDVDLSSIPQYPQSQAIINHLPIRWEGYPLPRYTQINEYYINCPLENENMNIDFIIFVIIIFLTLYLFKKVKENNVNFMYWNFLKWPLIVYWWFFTTKSSNLNMFTLLPFSFFDIDFRESFDWEINSYRDKSIIPYFKIQRLTEEIQKILTSLKHDVNYSMSLSYISSYTIWKDNKEVVKPLFIDNPIIVNKESDPILITQFIMNTLNEKGYLSNNWLFKDSSINLMDPVILSVIIAIKVTI
jgi:hypothetical protein